MMFSMVVPHITVRILMGMVMIQFTCSQVLRPYVDTRVLAEEGSGLLLVKCTISPSNIPVQRVLVDKTQTELEVVVNLVNDQSKWSFQAMNSFNNRGAKWIKVTKGMFVVMLPASAGYDVGKYRCHMTSNRHYSDMEGFHFKFPTSGTTTDHRTQVTMVTVGLALLGCARIWL